MGSGQGVVAAAGRLDQLRPMTPREVRERQEHLQAGEAAGVGGRFRTPILSGSGQVLHGPVHGAGDGATLCGIPQAEIFVMRHLFYPAGGSSCPDCAAAVRGEGS